MSARRSGFKVDQSFAGSRLDRFVRASVPGLSYPAIQMLARKGLILLNGARTLGSERVKEGDLVEIALDALPMPPRRGRTAARARAPLPMDLAVLYEDDVLLVVDKPPNVVVQPGNAKERGSLLDVLEALRARGGGRRRGGAAPILHSASGAPEPSEFPWTPVHRLDREVTGALVVAKTRAAARALSAAFRGGAVEKRYLAVVEGVPARREGTIDSALETEKGSRSRTRPVGAGKRAVTRYSVLAELPGPRALLAIEIETGRTHQIRAHLASIGRPVSGDAAYGRAPRGSRLLLHAWRIAFPHPATGDRIEVTAPPPAGIPPPGNGILGAHHSQEG